MPLVYCDYGLILQAVSNIVDNVLRYEPAGSQIEIQGTHQPTEVRLAVINHGPTISAEEKALLMEPFYHGRDGHVGLGLAISRGIVQAHQGRLWVEDTPGGGATFVMALPLDELDEKPNLHLSRG
jgi:two-component system, OmpR family, sensor histidine kinase KdpD